MVQVLIPDLFPDLFTKLHVYLEHTFPAIAWHRGLLRLCGILKLDFDAYQSLIFMLGPEIEKTRK